MIHTYPETCHYKNHCEIDDYIMILMFIKKGPESQFLFTCIMAFIYLRMTQISLKKILRNMYVKQKQAELYKEKIVS